LAQAGGARVRQREAAVEHLLDARLIFVDARVHDSSSGVGSSGSAAENAWSSDWPLFLIRISTFCWAALRELWQWRVRTTPRSKVFKASSSGRSPRSRRSTSCSSSPRACSKSSSFGVDGKSGLPEKGRHVIQRLAHGSNGSGAARGEAVG